MAEHEENNIVFVLSDSSKTNSKGFRVLLSGGRYDRFDANPVMLYDHDTGLVIGRWEGRKIEEGRLTASPVFDMGDAVAAEKARKVKDGFLKGASIGIQPLKFEEVGDEFVLTEWELIEASITPIPSDAGAIMLYNEKREVITFEQFRLGFSNPQNNSNNMSEPVGIVLSAATLSILKLSGNPTAKHIELAVQELADSVAEKEKEIGRLKKANMEEFLSAAVKDGKITEEEKTDFLELAQSNPDKVKSLIGNKKAAPATTLAGMAKNSGSTNGDRAGWDFLKWAKEDPRGLQKMRVDNPTEFERLKNEHDNRD